LVRDVSSRLTFDPKDDIWPFWSPDQTRIAFASNRSGTFCVMSKLSNGTGSDEFVFKDTDGVHTGPSQWSRDGKSIAVGRYLQGQWDVGVLDVATHKCRWVLTTNFNEQYPALSPDGRYMAYQSDETGVYQVYVLDLAGAGGKWQISNTFGVNPTW
jgi:Tol biopolymer transport system component